MNPLQRSIGVKTTRNSQRCTSTWCLDASVHTTSRTRQLQVEYMFDHVRKMARALRSMSPGVLCICPKRRGTTGRQSLAITKNLSINLAFMTRSAVPQHLTEALHGDTLSSNWSNSPRGTCKVCCRAL